MALTPAEFQVWQRKVRQANLAMSLDPSAAYAISGMSREEAAKILRLEDARMQRNKAIRVNHMLVRRKM